MKVKSGARPNRLAGQGEFKEQQPLPLCFNFAHLDQTQGQTLAAWEKDGLLSQMLTRFRDHGTKQIAQCFSKTFKSYKSYPPESDFSPPAYVPQDAIWASMHLCNRVCVGGHIVRNIFFVVFLDKDHRFWPTEKNS